MNNEKLPPNKIVNIEFGDKEGKEYAPEAVFARAEGHIRVLEALAKDLREYLHDLYKSLNLSEQELQDEEVLDNFHLQLLDFEEELSRIANCARKCAKDVLEE